MNYLKVLFVLCLTGCTTVPINTEDKKPPSVSILGASNGNQISTNGVSASKTIDYGIGQDVGVFASTNDEEGAKSIKLTIISGAKFEVQRASNIPTRPTFTNELINTNQIRNGRALDSVTVGGKLIPTSPETNIVVEATGEDFAGNEVITATLTFIPKPSPVARISVSNNSIIEGDDALITYETEHATNAYLNGVSQSTLNGFKSVSPTETTTYFLAATSPLGRTVAETTIQVIPPDPVINEFSISPQEVFLGDRAAFRWDTVNAQTILITKSNGSDYLIGGPNGNSSQTMNEEGRETYTLHAQGTHGRTETKTASILVKKVVVPPPPPPIENCFITCVGSAPGTLLSCFQHDFDTFDGSVWSLDLHGGGLFSGLGAITSIKNSMSQDIYFERFGDGAPIRSGSTTHRYDGLSANAEYMLGVVGPRPQTNFLQIEICHVQ